MAYEVIAGSCDEGPCPTVYRDPVTGTVLVQGYVTADRPPGELPEGEAVVRIDPSAWALLREQL